MMDIRNGRKLYQSRESLNVWSLSTLVFGLATWQIAAEAWQIFAKSGSKW